MADFVNVSWTGQPITVDKLEQMVQNDQTLFELKPEAALKHNGVSRDRGVKILSGSKLFEPSNTWSTTVDVYFGNYFSAGCSPVVMATHYGYPQTGMNTAVKGLGGTKIPDHRGFSTYVWADARNGLKGKIIQPYYIAYVAVGF